MAFKRRRTPHTHNLRCAALRTRLRKETFKQKKAMTSEQYLLQVKNAHFNRTAWPGPRWVATREKDVHGLEDPKETTLHDDDDDVSRHC